MQEHGNISARGRLARANAEDVQRDHGKKHDGEGPVQRSQRRIFSGPLFSHVAGYKFMAIKCELIRKTHSQALIDHKTTPLPASQTFYSHHDSRRKPDKRPTKHPDAAAGKLPATAQQLGCRAARFTPWVPRGGWFRCWTRQKGSGQHGWGCNTGSSRRRCSARKTSGPVSEV